MNPRALCAIVPALILGACAGAEADFTGHHCDPAFGCPDGLVCDAEIQICVPPEEAGDDGEGSDPAGTGGNVSGGEGGSSGGEGGSSGGEGGSPGGEGGSPGGGGGSPGGGGGSPGGEAPCDPDGSCPKICCNGLDDDGDGTSDEDCDCLVPCEESEGGNCNSDPGYGDCCDASCNTYGCSSEKFWAWCNRRNEAYPNIWPEWIWGWVEENCMGDVVAIDDAGAEVALDDYESVWKYLCIDAAGVTYECTTPLVLVFDETGDVTIEPGDARPAFALDPALGTPSHDWPTAATPWLALDRDGNGRIDDGGELFGSATPLAEGGRARNGFEALAELDADGDGWVTARDPGFARLLVWRDDGDRVSRPGELEAAAAAGLLGIALAYDVAPGCDARGNCGVERAEIRFVGPDGVERAGRVVDVHLSLRSRLATAGGAR